MIPALLILLSFLFWVALVLLRRSQREARRGEEYRRRCLAYERGLGLPFWSRSETDQAIWARAAAGEEEAWEILSSLQDDDPPLRF